MKNVTKILLISLFMVLFVGTAQAAITVTSPEAGEMWEIGQYGIIEWQKGVPGELYSIELWEDSVVFDGTKISGGNVWRINANISGNSYVWKVGDVDCGGPCTTPSAGKYKVIVRNQNKSSFLGKSESFSLAPSYMGATNGSNIAVVKPVTPAHLVQRAPQQKGVTTVASSSSADTTQMASALQAAQQILLQMLSYLKGLLGQ